MRVMVLGGTRFIGRATVEELVVLGHEVAVVHRGQTEPEGFSPVEHIHTDRSQLREATSAIAKFAPEGCIDCLAMTGKSAQMALSVIPSGIPTVVLSSADVYRAYSGVMSGTAIDPVPLSETSPVREKRYPYRGSGGPDWIDDYEKLDVEEEYLARDAIVVRLPMVYGEHDGQRREEFILRRVRGRRTRVPIGAGTWLSSRGYVRDMARGIVSALMADAARGEILNLSESVTSTVRLWAERIFEAAGYSAELVRVPDDKLPPDLGITGALSQHLLMDSSKARTMLDWKDGDPDENLKKSVLWHLANPPVESSDDFSADDEALAAI